MNYHIDTGLIIQAYEQDTECPLCYVYSIVNSRILEQFATEAVMEDGARTKVNKFGFCPKHFSELYEKPNKLGIALQTSTRLRAVRQVLFSPKNHKQAKELAKKITDKLSTCLLCDLIAEHMTRYYKTFAQMFLKEKDFQQKIRESKGFCLSHYAKLLEHSNESGSKTDTYLETLSTVMKENLDRLQQEIDYFAEKFDYRNTDKPWGNSKDAVPRTIKKIQKND